jgi:hypothetical protein
VFCVLSLVVELGLQRTEEVSSGACKNGEQIQEEGNRFSFSFSF